ncbi:anhydro-N-acetylmuramic acid kinase [Leucothrix pacifica]|uniref:Anhydro-N-acetylmuramic acid kinase n=2 Tax=Leucothrix pacifica TaxID=1247513 RepID=A0A317CFX7_9GAMM|nr:anhydro-N-acetylmuramic acid kinase [Leucothrix pacifica]
MSGTSMDAIDAVLVCFKPDDQLETSEVHSTPFPEKIRQSLRELIKPDWAGSLKEVANLNATLGTLYAQTAQTLIDKSGLPKEAISAIGNHGQTVWHQPDIEPRFSWQLGDANQIAEITGVTTIADFRNRDIAAGGEGAPLVPAFHQSVFSSANKHRVVVNIGGISNISVLSPEQSTIGFDTGPGNALMDAWCLQQQSLAYDKDGQWAASGQCNQALLQQFLQDPYFKRPYPKSTGKEYFNLGWLNSHLDKAIPEEDVQATLLELTAVSIQQSIMEAAPQTEEVYICGGGARNNALMSRLRALMPAVRLEKTDVLGIDADWVEAIAFAWLARQTLKGLPGNLPSATGAKDFRVLGAIYTA